jgi:hypothetical protein
VTDKKTVSINCSTLHCHGLSMQVAYRREKGQKVVYVSGLAKCLAEYLSDKVCRALWCGITKEFPHCENLSDRAWGTHMWHLGTTCMPQGLGHVCGTLVVSGIVFPSGPGSHASGHTSMAQRV